MHFSRKRFSLNCVVVCNFSCYFLTFQSHFVDTISQFNDIFFHQSICMLDLNYFIVKFFFIWVGLKIKSTSKCVARKVLASFFHTKILFNLAIYVAKWLQIWFMSCTSLEHVHYKIVRLRFIYLSDIVDYNTSKAMMFLNPSSP